MTRTLIQGATVITMDRQGVLPRADVLVIDDRIEAIAPSIAADDAQTIDATGHIVIPGLINAHMHTWQTGLRGVAANWTLPEYFKKMHAGLATAFDPEDLHIATLVGALNQLNCGTTTLADWCHNNRTPAHNDAAVEGLLQSGIRAAFFHGTLVISADGSVGIEWWESARNSSARELAPALVVSTPDRVHVEWTCCDDTPGKHFVVLEAAIHGEELDGQLRWETSEGPAVGWSPIHGDRVRMFAAP